MDIETKLIKKRIKRRKEKRGKNILTVKQGNLSHLKERNP